MGYRYIGSKSRIVEEIIEYLGLPEDENVSLVDAFSVTGVVAERAAKAGWKVKINDMMKYATVLSQARLLSKSDVSFDFIGGYDKAVEHLKVLEPIQGFFGENTPLVP